MTARQRPPPDPRRASTAWSRFLDHAMSCADCRAASGAQPVRTCYSAADTRQAVAPMTVWAGGPVPPYWTPHRRSAPAPPPPAAESWPPPPGAGPTDTQREDTTMPVEMPAPELVAEGAMQVLALLKSDREFDAFRAASLEYSDDWQCFTGFPVVSEWKLEQDAEPLFEEGLRALALKAAAYALTGDEQVAETPSRYRSTK